MKDADPLNAKLEPDQDEKIRVECTSEEAAEKTQSLEEDPRLLELAKQAAQCKHEVQCIPYDRSQGVDIADIKFVVIELVLPLGSK